MFIDKNLSLLRINNVGLSLWFSLERSIALANVKKNLGIWIDSQKCKGSKLQNLPIFPVLTKEAEILLLHSPISFQ